MLLRAFALVAAVIGFAPVAGCDHGHHDPLDPARGGPRVEPPPPVEALRETILASLALHDGMRVAEIGLGRGWFVFRAARAVGPSGKVYATDIDPESVRAMRAALPQIDPAAAPVDVRLCRGGRDTALDDVPDGSLDVVLMIDSLCFDGSSATHDEDVAYLRRFASLLAAHGTLVHHMDCNCATSPPSVEALFREAGFDAPVAHVTVPDVTPPRGWACDTEEKRARQAWVGVFAKR